MRRLESQFPEEMALIKHMLAINPLQRITTMEAMSLPMFHEFGVNLSGVLQRYENLRGGRGAS